MKTSKFDNSMSFACRWFIYLALLLMFVLMFVSGVFSGKGIASDTRNTFKVFESNTITILSLQQ